MTFNSGGFGLGEYIGSPLSNTWTVTSGAITSYDFSSLGTDNTSPAVTSFSLAFEQAFGGENAGLSNSADSVYLTSDINLTFTPVSASVPDPGATLALLSIGFIWLGALRRFAKRGV